MALAMAGFTDDADKGSVLVGFGRNAVLGVADKVIEAVKSKAIRHFFLVGGCDGAKPGRNYYTKFVEQVPKDCVVLTLACGKFRFFDKQLGDIGGIPRLLDVGQCNDAYSAIQIAVALAEAFNCGVNDLPLSMILSWYEQKAVAILLTLLYLGIKDIRLGPSLPAFITPAVLAVPGGHLRHQTDCRNPRGRPESHPRISRYRSFQCLPSPPNPYGSVGVFSMHNISTLQRLQGPRPQELRDYCRGDDYAANNIREYNYRRDCCRRFQNR